MHAKQIGAVLVAVFGAGSMQPAVRTQGTMCLAATASGEVLGVDRGASCAFLGVPFASPPVGALRWKPPAPAAPWAPVVLKATAAPSSCPLFNQVTGLPSGSEDCLKMNIWTPHPGHAPVPVIVWFHPGSFVAASANLPNQNGQRFSEETGAIVVAPNYRLGPFGFLGHRALRTEDPLYPSAGNYGLLDQRAALAWVRTHIAAFGGDPQRITIAGQSAGGLSVSLHLVSPGSDGLFDGAIMQGGAASYRWRTRDDAEQQADAVAASLGCTDESQVLTCLRSKTRDQLLRALPMGQEQFAETGRTHWGPIVDGFEIPDQPRRLFESSAVSHVPVIIGVNRDEGWTWVDRSFPAGLTDAQYQAALATEFGADAPAIQAEYPAAAFASAKDALGRAVGDAECTCGALRLARLIEQARSQVYLYSFEYAVDTITPGRAFHGLDVNFVFGNNFGPPSNYVLNDDDVSLFRAISGYWARFARTGNPNTEDALVVHWPRFKHPTGDGRGSDKFLVLDRVIREDKRPREAQCTFWEPYFFRSITAAVPAWTP